MWHANVRTERIEERFAGSNFDWTLPASHLPSIVIRGVDSLSMKHNQAQRTNEWLYEYLHHNWNYWIIFCWPDQNFRNHLSSNHYMSESLHSVTQHNIFELALTPDDEDSSHSFGKIKLQTIQIHLNANTCKEWNKYLNETDLRKCQLSNCCTSGLWNCPLH